MQSNVINRFIRYIKIDTQSNPESTTFPSTKKQFHLGQLLVRELNSLELENVNMDENGYVMATLASNIDYDVPTIGFIAHMDTAPDISGKGVNPQFVENYDGSDIVLHKKNNIILSPKDFPQLKKYIGKTLITTDGTTLLGADDKAGIAEIMEAMEFLVKNPDVKHGTIKIGFTPDEEIGKGADFFDVKKFGADFAYTIDGGELGELEYENFNAAGAKIKVNGRNVHPGTAKNQMINSIQIAMELHAMLPTNQRPEHTEGYEGFFMLMSFKGTVENTNLSYIIRDHCFDKFNQKKKLISSVIDFINNKYGDNTVEIEIQDSYFNMKEKIKPVMHIVDTAKEALIDLEIEPIIKPIRGGTDGSKLSFKGLPTPNIFTGGHNFHGKYEYIPVESIERAVEVILKIIEKYTKKAIQ